MVVTRMDTLNQVGHLMFITQRYIPGRELYSEFIGQIFEKSVKTDAWESPRTHDNTWYASRRTQTTIDEFEDFLRNILFQDAYYSETPPYGHLVITATFFCRW